MCGGDVAFLSNYFDHLFYNLSGLVGGLEFNVPFRYKYGYIRDDYDLSLLHFFDTSISTLQYLNDTFQNSCNQQVLPREFLEQSKMPPCGGRCCPRSIPSLPLPAATGSQIWNIKTTRKLIPPALR